MLILVDIVFEFARAGTCFLGFETILKKCNRFLCYNKDLITGIEMGYVTAKYPSVTLHSTVNFRKREVHPHTCR